MKREPRWVAGPLAVIRRYVVIVVRPPAAVLPGAAGILCRLGSLGGNRSRAGPVVVRYPLMYQELKLRCRRDCWWFGLKGIGITNCVEKPTKYGIHVALRGRFLYLGRSAVLGQSARFAFATPMKSSGHIVYAKRLFTKVTLASGRFACLASAIVFLPSQ